MTSSKHGWPIFEPQTSAQELAGHPHRVDLQGELGDARLPEICASCGAVARRCVAVSKVFRDTGGIDGVTCYEIQTAGVPFCEPCIAEHESERRVLTPMQSVFVSISTGLSVSALGSIFMAVVLMPAAWRSLWQPGFPLPLIVVLVFAAIAASSANGAWRQTAYRRVPPQTRITCAFDFSASDAPLFGEKRFVCSIRDASFAKAFIDLNRARVRA